MQDFHAAKAALVAEQQRVAHENEQIQQVLDVFFSTKPLYQHAQISIHLWKDETCLAHT